jgi:hypothetical protein
MAKKHCRSNRHRRRHSHRRSHRQRGGGGWTSASTYGGVVNGSGPEQFDRTFSTSGPYASRVGSEYVGAQGQWATQPNTPSSQNLSLIQSAGKKKKRGGFLGPVIGEAIVPAAILGLQQTYRRRGNSKNRSFRHRRFSRRR